MILRGGSGDHPVLTHHARPATIQGMSVTAYVALGSNEGSRLASMRQAVRMLGEHPDVRIERVSPVYETEPEPPHGDQPDYLNGVARISTLLAPRDLLELMATIEADLGRVRRGAEASRPIDLDLLLYGDLVIDTPRLVVPHPRLSQRRFVLTPLLDIDGDLADPRDGSALADHLAALAPSRCSVRRHASLYTG